MKLQSLLIIAIITLTLFALSLFNLPWTTPSASGQTVPTRVKSPTPGPPTVTTVPPTLTPPGIRDCRLQTSADSALAQSHTHGLFDIFLPIVSHQVFSISIAAIGASHSGYVGPCPGHFDFGAILAASGSGTGQFCWEKSNGTTTAPQTITFVQSGEQTVHDGWDIYSSGTFYERLHVLVPNEEASWVSVSNICW